MGPEMPEFHTRMGYEVGGKTLGIVGMGNIGLQIAKMARAFNMKIVYHNRNRRWVEKFWNTFQLLFPKVSF